MYEVYFANKFVCFMIDENGDDYYFNSVRLKRRTFEIDDAFFKDMSLRLVTRAASKT